MADDNLTPLDAGFLEAEDSDPHASLTIGAIAIIAGPPPNQIEFLESVAQRLSMLPHARQRVRTLPLDLGSPTWEDDPLFDIGHHIRRVALPHPGEADALFGFVGRVMGHRLDRDRPLWECWVIEGLANDRWAVLAKMHHCMADGIAGARLFEALCDEATSDSVDTGAPHAEQESRGRLSRTRAVLSSPSEQLDLVAAAFEVPRRVAVKGLDTARGFARLVSEIFTPASPTSLIGPIGKQRRYRAARISMSETREICDAYGVTVNDVALAAITSGFRHILLKRGERPRPHTVRTLVPVSVRPARGGGTTHNEMSLMLPYLPVDVADNVQQLMTVHRRLATHKAGKESEGGHAFTTLAQYGPFMAIAWAVRLATRLPQHSVVTIATNVPGPKRILHVMGREILEINPCVPIALRLRIGIAILSYRDNVSFGITGDFDTTPDITDFADAIERAAANLLSAARRVETEAALRAQQGKPAS
ncbi:acyltransferase [Rhodococcus sp. WMMA185]|uniref:WS/DGAT/MGAT family O-acyltransferase n=1 Tax=Rhodococcus sp. WMMA185 TaxID=679318 RepID=UPI000877F997|nr:wax ester/triacylglycerol synthase family O-acyltransferase [Rhodococcus sp. WMMA185]AOW92650.1 acyltransferase [Rhodococcus sp. WMMA185]